jgi:hypothetical protein
MTFPVGTIHGGDAKPAAPSVKEIVEIQENKDNVSILMTKTSSGAQSDVVIGSGVASGSTQSAAQPLTLPNPEPPAEDWKILPATVQLVEL